MLDIFVFLGYINKGIELYNYLSIHCRYFVEEAPDSTQREPTILRYMQQIIH